MLIAGAIIPPVINWRQSPDIQKFHLMISYVSTIKKKQLLLNTRQFLNGLPANNVLLWGPRGTGKSSLIKALFNQYQADGLKIIEIQRDDMKKLPEICDLLYELQHRFILYCDDLSFEENDPGYKIIKVMLDGSIKQTPENVLIYASSNRRHLLPEKMQDNLDSGLY